MAWTGGCLCGAVRYRASADPLRAVQLPLRDVPAHLRGGVHDLRAFSGGRVRLDQRPSRPATAPRPRPSAASVRCAAPRCRCTRRCSPSASRSASAASIGRTWSGPTITSGPGASCRGSRWSTICRALRRSAMPCRRARRTTTTRAEPDRPRSLRLTGGCHCGNLRLTFETQRDPGELVVRACSCSFCRRHACARSDPAGRPRRSERFWNRAPGPAVVPATAAAQKPVASGTDRHSAVDEHSAFGRRRPDDRPRAARARRRDRPGHPQPAGQAERRQQPDVDAARRDLRRARRRRGPALRDPEAGPASGRSASAPTSASSRRTAARSRRRARYHERTHASMQAIVCCRHPVIAEIRGLCVGGGLELATDLRSPDLRRERALRHPGQAPGPGRLLHRAQAAARPDRAGERARDPARGPDLRRRRRRCAWAWSTGWCPTTRSSARRSRPRPDRRGRAAGRALAQEVHPPPAAARAARRRRDGRELPLLRDRGLPGRLPGVPRQDQAGVQGPLMPAEPESRRCRSKSEVATHYTGIDRTRAILDALRAAGLDPDRSQRRRSGAGRRVPHPRPRGDGGARPGARPRRRPARARRRQRDRRRLALLRRDLRRPDHRHRPDAGVLRLATRFARSTGLADRLDYRHGQRARDAVRGRRPSMPPIPSTWR